MPILQMFGLFLLTFTYIIKPQVDLFRRRLAAYNSLLYDYFNILRASAMRATALRMLSSLVA